jgi:hypothetical protein
MSAFMRRAGVFLLVLVAAGTAFGQSYVAFDDDWRRIVETLRFSLGPIKLDPLISLRDVGYDDNIYYENSGVGDYTGTLSFDVKAYLPVRHSLILYVEEKPEYNFYLHQTRERLLTNTYGAGLKYLLFGRFVLTGAFQSAESQRRQTPELGRPTRDTSRVFSLGLYYETARKTSLGLYAQSNTLSYEDIQTPQGDIPLSQTLNHQERSAYMEFYYRVFAESVFFLRGGATRYIFDSATATDRDSTSYQAYAGLRLPRAGPLRGTIALGYKTLVPRLGTLASYAGIVGNAEVEARFGWFSLRGLYQRDIMFSYDDTEFAYVGNRYRGGLSIYPFSFLRLDYGYETGSSDYPDVWNVPTGSGALPHRRDTLTVGTAGIIVRLFRTTGIGITYNRSVWISTTVGFDRKRNYIAAYVTQDF